MTPVTCDMCSKVLDPRISDKVQNPIVGQSPLREREYHTILDKTICNDCIGKFEDLLRSAMGKEEAYSLKGYKKNVREILNKYCNKTRGIA